MRNERKFRWNIVRIKRPKTMMKRLSVLAIGAFIITLYLIFQTGKLHGKGTGIHRLHLAGLFQQPTVNPIDMKYQGKERMPASIENLDEEPASHCADSLLEYYLTEKDGLEITWLKNTNTRNLIPQALDDYLLMMVEVDIQTTEDKITKNMSAVIPSYTDDEFELRLKVFLKYLARYSNKGVKLNIDSLETMKSAVQTLKDLQLVLHSPIWLSINVLQGPNSHEDTVDFQKAIDLVKEYYPTVTLSLGWTTSWGSKPAETGYSWYQVIKMAKLCVTFQQRVSFSIRAVFAVRSIRQIKWLVSLSSRFSVTLWMDMYDIISVSDMVFFRKEIDHRKVFYNLPNNVLSELRNTETITKENREGKWDRTLWKPSLLDDKSLAFLGEDLAVLEGDNSWLVTKVPHKPATSGRKNVEVQGNVQFVKSPIKGQGNSISRFSLFLRCSGVNPPSPKDVHGVRLAIMSDGTITLSSQNLVKAGVYKPQTMAKLPSGSCVSFRIIDSGEEQPILCTISVIDCETGRKTDESSEVSLHLRVPYDGSRQMFFIAVTGGSSSQGVVIENLTIS